MQVIRKPQRVEIKVFFTILPLNERVQIITDPDDPQIYGLPRTHGNTEPNSRRNQSEDGLPVLSVADSDPGSGAFLTPGFGIRDGLKVSIRIRDEESGSYFLELRNHFLGVKILKFFDSDGDSSDPGSGMEKSWIRDKHPGSATLGLLVGCVALKTGDHVLNVGSIVLGQETVSRLGIFHLQARTQEKFEKELRFLNLLSRILNFLAGRIRNDGMI
jgi:hypothetical protein